MRQPDVYTANAIKRWMVDEKRPNGSYIPSRPYGHNCFPLGWRFKLAWGVLTGRYDALNWE